MCTITVFYIFNNCFKKIVIFVKEIIHFFLIKKIPNKKRKI